MDSLSNFADSIAAAAPLVVAVLTALGAGAWLLTAMMRKRRRKEAGGRPQNR
jgi:hypothetical protein